MWLDSRMEQFSARSDRTRFLPLTVTQKKGEYNSIQSHEVFIKIKVITALKSLVVVAVEIAIAVSAIFG